MCNSYRTYVFLTMLFLLFLGMGGVFKASLAFESNKLASKPIESSQHKKNADGLRILREGARLINESGFFRLDGDGATFVNAKGLEFGGLANLNLERVVRVLKNAEEAENIRWIVSGLVTEFSDQNYLLISRAVYKSAAIPPVPDQLQ